MKIEKTYEGFLNKTETDFITKKSFKKVYNIISDIFKDYSITVDKNDILINFDLIKNAKIRIKLFDDYCYMTDLKEHKNIYAHTFTQLKLTLEESLKYINYDFYRKILIKETCDIDNWTIDLYTGTKIFNTTKILKYIFYNKEFDKEYNELILDVCKKHLNMLNEIDDIKQNLNEETLSMLNALKNAKSFDLI